ncbi:MAG: glycosyltransferase family 2 protein [Candidatus Gastranaerophilaceae bacterium]
MSLRNIDIVITMGGLGSRFREKGYNVPKYMIEAKGRPLFDWSMISLEGFNNNVDKYIFIALKDENSDIKSFINERCKILNIKNYKIIILDKLTDGQATTAMLAKEYWNENNALLIYNIDTYVESGEMNSAQLRGDGFIPCFQAEGDHWSFVRLDDNGEVVEIKEKERISNYCTLGAYYFKTCKLYEDLYNEFYKNKHFSKEKYVAPLYDYLLSKNGKIYISDVPPQKVHVLGTPDELEQFLNE